MNYTEKKNDFEIASKFHKYLQRNGKLHTKLKCDLSWKTEIMFSCKDYTINFVSFTTWNNIFRWMDG